MALRKKPRTQTASAVQISPPKSGIFGITEQYVPFSCRQSKLYYALREAVPVIDAAVFKLVRLTGGFHIECANPYSQKMIDSFVKTVDVGGTQTGLEAFVSSYFEQLLTCGTAAGEILTDSSGVARSLLIAPLENLELARGKNGAGVEILTLASGTPEPVGRPDLCLLSVLNPEPGSLYGSSLLKGMPFVSGILMKIFESTGINWERAGNIRFAVTYKPGSDSVDRAYAGERAKQMAEAWSKAMRPGEVRDFVCAGDVKIKVIGAESAIPDSEIPVRQMLEQIVAKTGIPPFMLGLAWSSTERMSQQQADALTSELEAYRRILTPVIEKICRVYLRSLGCGDEIEVVWNDITMQDEVALSEAELNRAKAEKIRRDTENEQIDSRRKGT
ncbi:MAG: serine/threonine protein phosphatase [Clostridia bacterium]|nr:serine/threonine protein phosphatase [Clostridia bacterium]